MTKLRFRNVPAASGLGTAAMIAALQLTSPALAQSVAPPPPPNGPAAAQPLTSPALPPAPPLPRTDGAVLGRPPVTPAPPPPPRPRGLTGSIVAARPFLAQITTRDGRSVTLALHQGTIINPLGTTLAPGMFVAVRGVPQRDGSVRADQIDLQPAAPRQRGRAPRAGGSPLPAPPQGAPAVPQPPGALPPPPGAPAAAPPPGALPPPPALR